MAGATSLFLYIPPELLKTRAQLEKSKYMKYSEIVPIIYRERGIRGFFQGYWITFLREVPGWGLYFGSFEYFKQHYGTYISGGIAGFLSWVPALPFDVIKTRIQKSEVPLSMVEASRNLYAEGGFGIFFKGFVPLLVRGTMINMLVLPVFDYMNSRYLY